MSESTETEIAIVSQGHQVGRAGPGSEVELPRDEVQRLRALGHLVDPNPRSEREREIHRHAISGGSHLRS